MVVAASTRPASATPRLPTNRQTLRRSDPRPTSHVQEKQPSRIQRLAQLLDGIKRRQGPAEVPAVAVPAAAVPAAAPTAAPAAVPAAALAAAPAAVPAPAPAAAASGGEGTRQVLRAAHGTTP